MNKILFKNLKIEIQKTKGRFFSLIAITLVGVAMFTGINSTTSTMKLSSNEYFKNQNMEDLSLITQNELTQEDIKKIENVTDVNQVEITQNIDAYMKIDEKEYVGRGLAFTNINEPFVSKGRLPNNNSEILADEKHFNLNDKVLIYNDLASKEYTVVGFSMPVTNFGVLYKGQNSLGLGKTESFFYVKDSEDFSFVKNNKALIKIDSNQDTYSEKYKKDVLKVQKELKIFFPNSYITSRIENDSVKNYKDDSEKIREIGAIFPLIFFITAALVSLSTMSRMIEDKRQENGLLKALGYNDLSIILFYVIYAFSASLIGLIFGLLIGYNLIPTVVLSSYHSIYLIYANAIAYDVIVGLLAGLISLGLVILMCIIALKQELREVPATLMRQKAPIAGKRIFLEKISFIWKKLNFTNKVTARNIFRYKKRFFMSIFGIMGCSALLLSGFGIKSSITPIKTMQYEDVYNYDLTVYTKDITSFDTKLEHALVKQEIIQVNGYDTNLMVSRNNEIEKMINFDNFSLKKDQVLISKKLASLLKVTKGDMLEITINGTNQNIKIGGVTTQYFGHYIYFDEEYYQELTTLNTFNSVLLKTDNIEKSTEELIQNNDVLTVISNEYLEEIIGNSMSGVDSVIFVMIAFAGLLALVVMYNLTIINLSERNRELATIKVLGFYDLELANYVYKENIVLAIIGTICGLLIGSPLHKYIIANAEVESTYFLRTMPLINYFLTFIITLFFAIIVNILLYKKIKSIDMIESLKSLE